MASHEGYEELDRRLSWWKDRLGGLTSLQLPTDFPRPFPFKMVEGSETLDLSDETCLSILQLTLTLSKKLQKTVAPFTLILSAFSFLLHRYTFEQDIVVGSSSTSLNPLVLRLSVNEEDTFNDLVAHVKQTEEEAEKMEVPYDKLYSRLRPTVKEEELYGPLFKVRFFNLVDVSPETLEAENCDWTVFVQQIPDARRLLPIRIQVAYNNVLYSGERMKEMLSQIGHILSAVVERPDTVISELSLVTPKAQAVLPDPTVVLSDRWEGAIFDVFTRNALGEFADKTAISDNEKSYSYKEVLSATNRVANYLVSHNIAKEDVVTIYAARCASLVPAIMGVLKSGATFSVIDPAYPPQRQTIYLTVAQPKGLVILADAGQLHPEVRAFVTEELTIRCELADFHIDRLGVLEDTPDTEPGVEVGPDNIGTLSFTSGSTGIPKGVRGRHISLTHFYPWMSEEFGLSAADRFTMLSGIAHDPIQRDVFTPLFLGASIHIPRAEDIGNPGQLAAWVASTGITITHLTPAMGQLLSANAVTNMPSLRHAFFVGDVLTKRDVVRLQTLATNVVVVNMYGTTETQRAVSFLKVRNDSSMQLWKDILPAGRGMKDVQLLILNKKQSMVGIGEIGEIFVRSPHLSAGYLRLEDQTAIKFIVNPFTKQPLDRMYVTGDLGRYMSDGTVECVGRADDQVKIRGFRIELGEIDAFLSQHPHVRENVTLVRRDAYEEQTLISYFVPVKEGVWDLADIRKWLRQKLPSYSIPSVFVPLSRMPLTPNGKVDKNALPFPDTFLSRQRVGSEVPSEAMTPHEKAVLQVWQDVLGRADFTHTDNFFDIGGHSILATRLIFQLRQTFKMDIPLDILFRCPTVKDISSAILRLDDVSLQTTAAPEEAAPVDLAAEARLDPAIVASDEQRAAFEAQSEAVARNSVFLTGATGFLGAFILAHLLSSHPTRQVHCLVRGATRDAGMQRLKANLEAHHLWCDAHAARVHAVVGDLAKPRFGLTDEEFTALAGRVGSVIHNGALVHWVYPYQKLKGPNVGGTLEALRLACTGPLKPVHFVSSTSVFDTAHYVDKNTPVLEDDDLAGGLQLRVGYGQSKWVSERLVIEARSRGIPTTIIRPGYITGDSLSGVTNTDDFIWRLVAGCIQLRQVPVMLNTVNMCPVDFVAAAIVRINDVRASLNAAYHMYNPNRMRFQDFFSYLVSYGYALETVDYMEWRKSLMDLTLTSGDNALFPLLHFVLDDLPTSTKSPVLDTANTQRVLEGSPVVCASIESLMGLYLANLVAAGFLPAPASDAQKQLPAVKAPLAVLTRSDRA